MSGTPGDYGVGFPTFLGKVSDPAVKKSKLNAELANGRLAMMAIIGMFFQDGVVLSVLHVCCMLFACSLHDLCMFFACPLHDLCMFFACPLLLSLSFRHFQTISSVLALQNRFEPVEALQTVLEHVVSCCTVAEQIRCRTL